MSNETKPNSHCFRNDLNQCTDSTYPFRAVIDFNARFGRNVADAEVTIDYVFSNKLLCAEALNHAGADVAFYVDDEITFHGTRKNDRLAVYGDRVAATALCRLWYSEGSERCDY